METRSLRAPFHYLCEKKGGSAYAETQKVQTHKIQSQNVHL